MEETHKLDSHITSAAAFVEGRIQNANDDSCSICLEEFSSSDPSTRSSQCPMCMQAISLKDSASQELLEAVERERTVTVTAPRNTTHLAAAMGRSHHTGMREGQRRSSSHGHPRYLVFSHSTAQHTDSGSSTQTRIEGESEAPAVTVSRPSSQLSSREEMSPFPSSQNTSASGVTISLSFNNRTRSWKERLFPRNSFMSDIGNEVRREVSAGIASVSRMMDRIEINGNNSENQASVPHHSVESSVTEQANQHNTGRNRDVPLTIVPSRPPHASSPLST
ncbi:hypothetical protein F3Y22_tig00110551pilonHSYRG00141 [Hibiscus syriacus]|uniref:RING-type domain-containing protein n=1 Tax=Hibiscus syriacus TaxID=106335 RepID=A0A6A3A9V8_HIBSY|nr:hypothetical protein F3Y22_tig00110551pilonHSYRG00141 [Hibiscus syriacus]